MAKKLVATVDDQTHERFKQRAEQLEMSMSELIRALINDNLQFNKLSNIDLHNKTYGELKELIKNPPNEVVKSRAEAYLRKYL